VDFVFGTIIFYLSGYSLTIFFGQCFGPRQNDILSGNIVLTDIWSRSRVKSQKM